MKTTVTNKVQESQEVAKNQERTKKTAMFNAVIGASMKGKIASKAHELAEDDEEDDVMKVINRGFDHYESIVKTSLLDKVAPFILSLMLSLSMQ